MFFSLQKNSEQLIVSCPEEERDGKQTQTDRLRPRCSLTLSFYLRDSAGRPTLHLRYSFLSFSRAASVPSPHPILRAPESFTPSVGFRRSPKNFNCRYQIAQAHHSTLAYECQPHFVFSRKRFVYLRKTLKTKKAGHGMTRDLFGLYVAISRDDCRRRDGCRPSSPDSAARTACCRKTA